MTNDLRKIHKAIASLANSTKSDLVLTNVDDDDCAIVKVGIKSDVLVATTDFINSSPAIIELGKGTWYHLGQLVACHNFADLAGSGCSPQFFMSGICAPRGTTERELLDFTQGVCDICTQYNASLIGGDTKFGSTRSIYGIALGVPLGSQGAFLRTQAKPGYKLIVTGPIGSFGAAVVCLSIGSSQFSYEELEQAKQILFRTYVPFDIAESISNLGVSCAGTDISDGLGTDVNDICQSSGVSAVIMESAIPIDEFTRRVAEKLNVPPWSFAFASGGDFACAFAVPSETVDECKIKGAHVIGHFDKSPVNINSGLNGNPLSIIGHTADRTTSFADEILSNIFKIKGLYDTKTN